MWSTVSTHKFKIGACVDTLVKAILIEKILPASMHATRCYRWRRTCQKNVWLNHNKYNGCKMLKWLHIISYYCCVLPTRNSTSRHVWCTNKKSLHTHNQAPAELHSSNCPIASMMLPVLSRSRSVSFHSQCKKTVAQVSHCQTPTTQRTCNYSTSHVSSMQWKLANGTTREDTGLDLANHTIINWY